MAPEGDTSGDTSAEFVQNATPGVVFCTKFAPGTAVKRL